MHDAIELRLMDAPVPRPAHECPVENWLAFIGHRWNAVLLWHLATGPKRHGELMAALPGITAKVLSERLDGLERHRLITRAVAKTFPRTVAYTLTGRGLELVAILNRIEVWAKSIAADVAADAS